MRVHVKGFENNNTDAILVIQCECGSKYMLDESGEFRAKKHFVYRHGAPVKNLRCSPSGPETLRRYSEGRTQCHERYRIAVRDEGGRASAEVAHVTPRPAEEVLESETIGFPPKGSASREPINPPPSSPYVNKPYDS